MKNSLLHLNKTFGVADRERTPFAISFYKSLPVTLDHLRKLLESLINTSNYWNGQALLGEKCLVSAYCFGIVAKSNRISELFKFKGSHVNDLVVGARFGGQRDQHCHIFTYCFSKA